MAIKKEKEYTVVKTGKRGYVLCGGENRKSVYSEANFMGTGKALCGVLEKGETIEDFKKKVQKIKAENVYK